MYKNNIFFLDGDTQTEKRRYVLNYKYKLDTLIDRKIEK